MSTRSPRQSPLHSGRSTRERQRPLAMTNMPSIQQLSPLNMSPRPSGRSQRPFGGLAMAGMPSIQQLSSAKQSPHHSPRSTMRANRRQNMPSFNQLVEIDDAISKSAGHGYKPNLALEPDLIAHLTKRVRVQEMIISPRLSRNSKVDYGHSEPEGPTNPGLPTSSETSYRLIPIAGEEKENEATGHSRTRKRRNERASRQEALANMPEWRIKGQEIIHGVCFQTIMAFLIISNSLVIGLETDITHYKHWDEIENLFLFCFLGELVLKMLFLGIFDLFNRQNPDINWNVFDCFIVSLGLVDFIMGLLTTSKGGSFATLFRIIRLLRILRIIRIVKFLKQLYLLAVGLAEAAQAVFWVTILMTFILYVCSIVMVKTIGHPPDTDPNQDFLNRHFGGVLPSMLSLFVLMSSPNLPVYQDQVGLLQERPLLALFLICFILFGSFGMLALLTGVISESMFEKNNMRKEEERIEHEKLRMDVGLRCEELYDQFDKNDADEVAIEDMKEDDMVSDMAKTFESAGVFVTGYDLCTMIDYLDVDGSGTINKDEFMRGMLVLAEGLRPITVQEVHHDVGVCKVKIERIEAAVESMMTELRCEGSDTFGKKNSPRSAATGANSSSNSILENISERIQDLAEIQKETCKSFQYLDGRMEEISRHVKTPDGEDIASLKTYLSTSFLELSQHVTQECERSYSSSNWNDAKFGVPVATRSQASCGPSTAQDASALARRDSTFSFAGSSAEQTGEARNSVVSNSDQLTSSTSQQMEETLGRLAAAAAPSESAMASLTHPAQTLQVDNPSINPLEVKSSGTSNDVGIVKSQGLPLANPVQELISQQQRIETELQRVRQMVEQKGAAQAAQAAQLAPILPSAAALQAAEAPKVQQLLQPTPTEPPASPVQAEHTAKVLQDEHVLQALLSLQSQTQSPPSSSASAPLTQPALHPSVQGNTTSLAELLNRMHELVSKQDACQRLPVSTSSNQNANRLNEVQRSDNDELLPE